MEKQDLLKFPYRQFLLLLRSSDLFPPVFLFSEREENEARVCGDNLFLFLYEPTDSH